MTAEQEEPEMWWSRLLRALAVGLALMVIGCAYPISAPLRQQARKDLSPALVVQNPEANRGAVVIWGGVIQEVEQRDDGSTTLVVKEFPLDWIGEPNSYRESRGQFIANTPQYLDPSVYEQGRWVTVGGAVTGVKITRADRLQYRFPEVETREIRLWKTFPEVYSLAPYWTWGPPYDPYNSY
jgi:outer membrane lipoprotein